MKILISCKSVFVISLLLSSFLSLSQLPYGLVDGREHKYCGPCRQLVQEMSKEVLFGIHINSNGDIYFSMNNKKWFDKIFKNDSSGVTVDIVSNYAYSCGSNTNED